MARILKYRGGGMAPNSAASKLAKMLRSYRNGGYVYAQGSDEVPTTLTPAEVALRKKLGLSTNGGGEVPTGSSAPQAMTREEYLAFPENFMETFGIEDYLSGGRHRTEEERRAVFDKEGWMPEKSEWVDFTDKEKASIRAAVEGANLEKFWSDVMATPGGQKMTLPLTGHEWTRPKNLSWLAKEGPEGSLQGFGAYYTPKKMRGNEYYYPDQPHADIYYSMMDPKYQQEYARTYLDDDWEGADERREEMMNWFGSPFKRMIEEKMIEEAIRAKVRAQEAGVYD